MNAGMIASMAQVLEYDTERDDDGAVVRIRGDLDMSGTLRLEQELTRLIERDHVGRLTLDLSGVRFIDSTGLGLVINTEQAARQDGIALELVPASREVHRVFEMVGLADVLPFTGTPADG